MISRQLQNKLRGNFLKGKAILVLGARQTGKTTLLREIVKEFNGKYLWLDADEPIVRSQLVQPNIPDLKMLIADNDLLIIDEAQQIENIGLTLKLIIDHIPEVQLLVTGSSALELAESTSEPLTGRKFEYYLYPLAFKELMDHYGWLEEKKHLEQRLIFGTYPEVVTTSQNIREIITGLAGSYLYKDIFKYKDLRKPVLLENLLQALALQLGAEVSYHELSQILGADTETIQRYLDLLEKTYVIFRLRSFSRNLRNELKKSRKIYFYDNGIRNAVIQNFSPLNLRSDTGALWENYLISERIKFLEYNSIWVNKYFWRSHQQQEIDYIEEIDGQLKTFEFKWNPNKKSKIPLTFSKSYPNHTYNLINQENYTIFLSDKM